MTIDTVRRPVRKPPLTIRQILTWADAHHRRTGKWPTFYNGPVHEATEERWHSINKALHLGHRGLPAGGSLPRLLAKHRHVRNKAALPRLSFRRILAWADAYYRRTGRWPSGHSGPVDEAPGESWQSVETALREGRRGLPGGLSIHRLLVMRRGKGDNSALPKLTVRQLLAWADAYHRHPARGQIAIPVSCGKLPQRIGGGSPRPCGTVNVGCLPMDH